MNQPLIKNTLIHFLEWMENPSVTIPDTDEELVKLYLKEHPIPSFTEFEELEKLWSDPKSDYDMEIRKTIEKVWKVVKGE